MSRLVWITTRRPSSKTQLLKMTPTLKKMPKLCLKKYRPRSAQSPLKMQSTLLVCSAHLTSSQTQLNKLVTPCLKRRTSIKSHLTSWSIGTRAVISHPLSKKRQVSTVGHRSHKQPRLWAQVTFKTYRIQWPVMLYRQERTICHWKAKDHSWQTQRMPCKKAKPSRATWPWRRSHRSQRQRISWLSSSKHWSLYLWSQT